MPHETAFLRQQFSQQARPQLGGTPTLNAIERDAYDNIIARPS
jgi:hypothetical protein